MKYILLAMTLVASAETFEYAVVRDRIPRREHGRLEISGSGFHYRSDRGKTAIDIPFSNVFKADVSDPKVIRIETFDIVKRRVLRRDSHVFRLAADKHGEALARFLSASIQRPIIGVHGQVSEPVTAIRAYHRHRLGGCHGTVRIDAAGVRFDSDQPGESRTWLYREIETVGTMNSFHFRVTTLQETFNFDLKERLSPDVYDAAVRRIYRLPAAIPIRPEKADSGRLE